MVKIGDCNEIHLVTYFDDFEQEKDNRDHFEKITDSLKDNGIDFIFKFSNTIHDRVIKTSNGWRIVMGRGLDYFQSLSGNYYQVGANDQSFRPCLETSLEFIKIK